MKFFDKMYVGFKRNRYLSSEYSRVLGFVVPYGTTKAEKNRMKTVDRWADKNTPSRVLDNEPIRGFKIVESVSRHSTLNKLFRIQDPRGFELEIPADNLVDVLLTTTVVKGEIIDECVWAQHNKLILVPIASEKYQFHLKSKTAPKLEIEEGMYLISKNNITSIFRYEGCFHHTWIENNFIATEGSYNRTQNSSIYDRNKINVTVDAYDANVTIRMNSGKKPIHVYTEFRVDENGIPKSISFLARKTKLKDMSPYSGIVDDLILDYKFDPLRWVKDVSRYSKQQQKENDSKYENIFISAYLDTQVDTQGFGLFKNKQDAIDFDYSTIFEENLIPSTRFNDMDTKNIYNSDNSYYYRPVITNFSPNMKRVIHINDKRE